VQTPIGIGIVDIRNAAAATIRGVEVENTSRLGRGVEAGGHVTWLDATYDSTSRSRMMARPEMWRATG
jgi:outer membrane receptor protein involved in Fe transport